MSSNLLSGPKVKLSRAKGHLKEFEQIARDYFDTYEDISHSDAETGERVVMVRVREKPPDELSVIVGDIVHNLRSALDQLICGLVRANQKQVSYGNGFPISSSKKKFDSNKVGKLRNVTPKAHRFIDRLKPYLGGSDLLWLLAELDNLDKHNEIVPVAMGTAQVRVRMLPIVSLLPEEVTPTGASPVPIAIGDNEIHRLPRELLAVTSGGRVGFNLVFGKTRVTKGEIITRVMEEMINLVDRIIDIVERRIL